MKRTMRLLALAGVMVFIAGCSMSPAGTDSDAAELGTIDYAASAIGDELTLSTAEQAEVKKLSDGKLIGIVCATMSNEYHKILCEGAKARAEALGFKAEIFDAQEDANRELQGFEGFISKGAVAILEDSLGGEAITAQLEQAKEKGIVVVQLANRTLGESGAITVAVSDETIAEAAGTAAGEYATKNFPGETITSVMLDYPDIPSLVARADMIEKAFTAAFSGVTFLPRVLGGTAENGFNSVETLAQQHRDIKAVVGINDAGNLGAYQALVAAGFSQNDVFIFGIDCDPQALDLISQGTMYKGCVDTNPAGTGGIAVDAFARLLLGQTVPATIEVPVIVQH